MRHRGDQETAKSAFSVRGHSTRRFSLRWQRRSRLRNRKWFCDWLVGTFRMCCLLRVFSRGGCSLSQRGNLLSHIPFRRLEGRDVLGHLLLLARDLLRGTAHDGEIAREPPAVAAVLHEKRRPVPALIPPERQHVLDLPL